MLHYLLLLGYVESLVGISSFILCYEDWKQIGTIFFLSVRLTLASISCKLKSAIESGDGTIIFVIIVVAITRVALHGLANHFSVLRKLYTFSGNWYTELTLLH